MTDLWILAFVFRGVIAAAGDTMPLAECEARAGALPGEAAQHAVCINVQSPTCRVYIEDKAITVDVTAQCRKRVSTFKPRKDKAMSDTTSAAPSDVELEALWDEAALPRTVTKRVAVSFARAVLAKWGAPQPVANQAPAPSFDDPRVQVVYSTICDDADWPPNGAPQQHWEGWIARRIVERLDACKTVARVPLTDEQIAAIWAQKPRYHAAPIGRTDIEFARAIEAAHGIGTEKGNNHGLQT